MHKYIKVVPISAIVIVGLFLLLYFLGNNFISKISPEIQVSSEKKLNSKVEVGSDIPYFDLSSILGGRINSQDTKDQPLVLTFWSTWNTESVDQIKIIDDYLLNQDVELPARILTIDSQETKSAAINMIRRGGYKLDVLIDESGEVSNNFEVKTLPTTFFINKEGIVVEIFVGTISEKELVDKIENIIH